MEEINTLSSSSSSSAWHRALQFLAISLDPRSHPGTAGRPANPHSTWPEGVLHYVYRDAVSTPELVLTFTTETL
jgi:hypothetical protein